MKYFYMSFAITMGLALPVIVILIINHLKLAWLSLIEQYKSKREKRNVERILSKKWCYDHSYQCPNESIRIIVIRNYETQDYIEVGIDKKILKEDAISQAGTKKHI